MATDRPKVKATETTFEILDVVRERSGISLTELAVEIDISKSAVYKHLQTLLHLGYLYQEDSGYHLSNRFRKLSSAAGESLPVESVQTMITDLAETTGHVSNFIAHEDDCGVYVVSKSPDGVENNNSVGDVAPLHASAGGKAILAFLSPERREATLDRLELERYTKKTITDRRELVEQLQLIHDRRVAFDRQEFLDGYQCVASPVLGSDGELIGAVSVTGNVSQMSGKRLEEDVVGLVTSAAQAIKTDSLPQ